MRIGDRVECINELSPLYRHIGRMTGVTKDGRVLVQFPAALGEHWDVPFQPHDLELASLTVHYWEASPWLERLALIKVKHSQRVLGPDEEQLASWRRTS